MTTKHASPDTSAHPTKDEPTCPERDARESAQDDNTDEQPNNSPPDHGIPTHGIGRFLWEVDKDTPIPELGERYREWHDETEQAALKEWSE